jgi:Uma2 family endonuclease
MATTHTEERLLTVDDLFAMAEEGHRLELIDGKLLRMAPTGFEHSWLLGRLSAPLILYVESNQLGYVGVGDPGFILARDPYTYLAPDLAFIRSNRMSPKISRIPELVPDLVVEVISPSDSFNDVTAKVSIYLARGVQAIWVVQPPLERVLVYRPDEPVQELGLNDVLTGDDIVPGFRIPVTSIFR